MTSATFKASEFATAFAIRVLPHPGGPYNKIPLGAGNSYKEKSGEYIGQGDYDPKAVRDEIYYTVNTGEIYLQCVTWSKKVKKKENLFDSLRVSIMNNEFSYWLSNEAYK